MAKKEESVWYKGTNSCKTLEVRQEYVLLEKPREIQCDCKVYNVQDERVKIESAGIDRDH